LTRVGARLPIFCLNSVLFPGMRLPLHVFEDRYRRLMQDVFAAPEPRRFGVVAIREGYEVGSRGVQSAHRVGCEAEVVSATMLPDGRSDLEVVGRRRFRVGSLDTTQPYPVAEVLQLEEALGEQVREAAAHAAAAFQTYRDALSRYGGAPVLAGDLPRHPLALSYFVAATALLTLPDRQALLEAPDAASRLRAGLLSLRVEQAAMRAVPSLPAMRVARTAWSPN
jgi:Lon protease-like protein